VLVVVLDSATPAITAAVASIDPAPSSDPGLPNAGPDVTLLAERVHVDGRAHGELLAPEIASVLSEVGKVAADVGAVIVGVGPGPFTGLRVGLVTAAAFADTLDIPAYGVGTLDAIGAGAGPGTLLVATDARRREVYWAIYRDGVRMTEPSVDRPADLVDSIEFQSAGVEAAVGAGAQIYASVIGLPIRDEPTYPPAGALASLAAARVLAGGPTEPLTPLYLRRPDVVEPGQRKAVS
jgi:tRNA threonylcarbamoyl adenosine modification protein YeaZ